MSEMRVALTFDAEHPSRPHWRPGNEARILSALADSGVTATFFLQGRWLTSSPDLGQRATEQGHLIGNHSHAHDRLTRLSREGLLADVREAEENIRELTGRDPRPWFRCPFGDGAEDDSVLGTLGAMGYRHIHWDVDSCDWCDGQQPDTVRATVVEGVKEHGDGAIVLMHTWPNPTADGLPALISELRSVGARFVTVKELSNGD